MKAPSLTCSRHSQRGAGALVAVILLYVAMSIIVVFTNRNLLVEQKTSTNQYRSTLALEAAEAGLEWAVTMMNKPGAITAQCLDSAVNTDVRFRDKYMSFVAASDTWLPTASNTVVASCVTSQSGTDWTCRCPTAGTAPAVAAPAVGGYKPGFSLAFVTNTATRAVDLVSYGCTSAINSNTCAGDAAATVRVTVANVTALASAPGAPLIARGQVSVTNGSPGVHNGDQNSGGVTVNAGMGIQSGGFTVTTIPGTPASSSLIGNDASLRTTSEDQMFQTFFGMPKNTWRDSVADARIDCSSTCGETNVSTALGTGTGGARRLWLQGNLVMNASPTLGSPNDPYIMVVDGTVEVRGNVISYGVIYSTAATWDNRGSGSATMVGSIISEGNFINSQGNGQFYYDPRVNDALRKIPGPFVRVPGTWRDF